MGLSLSTCRLPPSLWSGLLPDLGGLILRRLPSHADRRSFRAVCRQWRLAAQQEPSFPPAPLPWIRLNDLTFQSLPGGELRRLKSLDVPSKHKRGAAICFRSTSDGWLLMYYNNSTGKCFFLINPFTGATISLPPEQLLDSDELFLKKVVCSPDLVAVIFGSGTYVWFYRPGDAPTWSIFPRIRGCRSRHEDIAFYRGKLYALNSTDDLFCHELAVDGNGHEAAAVEHVIKQQVPSTYSRRNPRHLVASCGKLLLVKWTDPCTLPRLISKTWDKDYWWDEIRLKVFEEDLETGRWLELKGGGLDDGHALFVSTNSSKAIQLSSSGNDQKFQQDHVYLPGAELQWMDKAFRSCLYVSYDLRNDRISQIVQNERKRDTNDTDIVSDWFFPSM